MYIILMFGTAQAFLIRGVSLFQNIPFQEFPYFRGVLISVVSGVPLFQGFISVVFLFQGCPYFRGILISGVSLFQECFYFRGVLISGVSLFQG